MFFSQCIAQGTFYKNKERKKEKGRYEIWCKKLNFKKTEIWNLTLEKLWNFIFSNYSNPVICVTMVTVLISNNLCIVLFLWFSFFTIYISFMIFLWKKGITFLFHFRISSLSMEIVTPLQPIQSMKMPLKVRKMTLERCLL